MRLNNYYFLLSMLVFALTVRGTPTDDLFNAAQSGNLTDVKKALQSGADKHEKRKLGTTKAFPSLPAPGTDYYGTACDAALDKEHYRVAFYIDPTHTVKLMGGAARDMAIILLSLSIAIPYSITTGIYKDLFGPSPKKVVGPSLYHYSRKGRRL